jgi:peptide/nickel transport system ATP-binding protein
MTLPLLSVRNLKLVFTSSKPVTAITGVSFQIEKGQTLALLGESGCGKSMTALSVLRLNPQPISRIDDGNVELNGQDLLSMTEREMQAVRGHRIAMIFQEPNSSLNPIMTVGQQIVECLDDALSTAEQQLRVVTLLEDVGIPAPKQRIHEYPHQLSGGMKQRIMIAMALAGEPDLLIADEPTTALDVTTQAQILDLLKAIQLKTGMAILLISHDLSVVATMADKVAVMYAGQIIETATRDQLFTHHQHPYTAKLFQALPSVAKRNYRLSVIKGTVPSLDNAFEGCRFSERCEHAIELCSNLTPKWIHQHEQGVMCHQYDTDYQSLFSKNTRSNSVSELTEVLADDKILLNVSNLKVHFPIKKGLFQRTKGYVKAVDGVDLILHQSETLAIVGESGCGKTTVGKGILQLVPHASGQILFNDINLSQLSFNQLRQHRKKIPIVFQDPFSSLNPRMTVRQLIAEALPDKIKHSDERIEELLQRVGLRAEFKHRYPHEFSGGQRQRISIARALATEPEIIICDEPTSALDVSVQAQILNLLREIQLELGVAYLFISHDIAVVSYLAHRVAVMYLGRIVEHGSHQQVLTSPKHPYTQALLSAVPELSQETEQIKLTGELPSPANPPSGCHFHQRCPHVMARCLEQYPETVDVSENHYVNCFLFLEE